MCFCVILINSKQGEQTMIPMINTKKLVELYLKYYFMVKLSGSKMASEQILYDTLMDWFDNDKNKVNCFINTQFNRIGYEMSIGKHDDLVRELTPIILNEILNNKLNN